MDKNEYKAEQVQDSMLSLKSFTGYSYSLLRYSNSGDSLDESFAKNNNIKFLFHCYDGTYEQAKIIVDNGGIISFSGILTFKNKTSSKEILSKLPLDSIVVETDAPFLAPEPMRGKANETGFVKYTAEFASRYLNVDYDVFCNQTTQNALKLFNQL